LPEEQKAKSARPRLNTPKADNYRKRALTLYRELERDSRGKDAGRSKLIDRSEVLFYLASTLMDLNNRKAATPSIDELTKR
jgi:hypothetical protein